MKKKHEDAIVKVSEPKPERLKIEGNWVKAVDHSLTVKRPPTGWPK